MMGFSFHHSLQNETVTRVGTILLTIHTKRITYKCEANFLSQVEKWPGAPPRLYHEETWTA